MRKLLTYVLAIGAVYGWCQFLAVPLHAFFASRSLGGMLTGLVTPESPLNQDLGGYLFLLLLLAVFPLMTIAGRGLALYWTQATVPISVLEMHMTLDLFDNLERSRLTRRQIFHANRPDQTAHISWTRNNAPQGRILRDSIKVVSCIGDEFITEELELSGNEHHLDIVEMYKRPLPTSWLATLLPDNFVRFLYRSELGAFRDVMVTRNACLENYRAYDGDEPHFGHSALRYPISKLTLTMRFPIDVAPDMEDLNVLLVKENSGRRLIPDEFTERDLKVYQITLNKFHHATLRFSWKNRKLARKRAVLLPKAA